MLGKSTRWYRDAVVARLLVYVATHPVPLRLGNRGALMAARNTLPMAKKIVEQEIRSPFWKVNDPIGGEMPEDRTWKPIEFSFRPHQKRVEPYALTYIEAMLVVRRLRREGHEASRAVIDLQNEVAYTCDICGLWQFTSHAVPDVEDSIEECEGDLFGSPCDPNIVVRKYGRIDYSIMAPEPQTDYGEEEVKKPKRKRSKKGRNDAKTTP